MPIPSKEICSLIATLFWVIIGAFALTGLYSLFTMITGKE